MVTGQKDLAMTPTGTPTLSNDNSLCCSRNRMRDRNNNRRRRHIVKNVHDISPESDDNGDQHTISASTGCDIRLCQHDRLYKPKQSDPEQDCPLMSHPGNSPPPPSHPTLGHPNNAPYQISPFSISSSPFSSTSSSSSSYSSSSSSDRLVRSVWKSVAIFIVVCIFLSSHLQHGGGVAALTCSACDLALCPEATDCPRGRVKDICGCCMICAKTENERCGGSFGIFGTCGTDLQCFIRPVPGKPITGSEEGICKAGKVHCVGPHCPPVIEPLLCPRDSYLISFANDMLRHNRVPRELHRVVLSSSSNQTPGEDDLDGDLGSATSGNEYKRVEFSNNEEILHQTRFSSKEKISKYDEFSTKNKFIPNDKVSPSSKLPSLRHLAPNELSSNELPPPKEFSSHEQPSSPINDYSSPGESTLRHTDNPSEGGEIAAPNDIVPSEGGETVSNGNVPPSEDDAKVSGMDVFPSKGEEIAPTSGENTGSERMPEMMSYCVCNKSRCLSPICAPGFSPVITQNATGLPGRCCDVFTCNKTSGCDPVICPPMDQTPCPLDSVRFPSIWTEDKCCEIQQGCTCPPKSRCEKVTCPKGFQVQITSRATRLPGSCCDRFRCVNESALTCRYDGKEIVNGHRWNVDKCRSCVCKDGLNRCRDKICGKLSCLWMEIPDDECCPICLGCSSGNNFYNNSDMWKENECTTCQCVEGQAQCRAETCAVYCDNPVRVEGQCCPVCPEPTPTTTAVVPTSRPCPSLDDCQLECSNGLELSPHGCFLCQCKKEKCVLDCPNGFKKDFEGNTLCECQVSQTAFPPCSGEPCEKKCEYGLRRNKHGCLKCKCNRCPPLKCTKRCLHGLLINDEGCRVCKCKEKSIPDVMTPSVTPDTIDDLTCLSQDGNHHENGESWNDGCRTCYCHKGVEMCSLIACRSPHCSNPVYRIGDCCPSCPGLTIPSSQSKGDKLFCQSAMGRYYVEGQTWQMDPCTRCVCHGGTILCETMSCRPPLCHHPIKPEGQCCPVCPGEDLSHLPLSPMHRRCKSVSGMVYKHGDVWRSTPCQTCVCQDGQFHCYNQMCAPLRCEKTISRKEQCCPTCAEPDIKPPQVCSYNGEVYDQEEEWKGENCTQCLCVSGAARCFPRKCPNLKCSVQVRMPGQCCPHCYETPIVSQESNGPDHNITAMPPARSGSGQGVSAGYIILGVLLLLLACVIVFLVHRLYFRRQKRSLHDTCGASHDELQGQAPFLPPPPGKTNLDVDIKQPDLEKLYSSLSDKSTSDRAYNTYTDLNFGDKTKNSIF